LISDAIKKVARNGVFAWLSDGWQTVEKACKSIAGAGFAGFGLLYLSARRGASGVSFR
jgi:hypothetical protein